MALLIIICLLANIVAVIQAFFEKVDTKHTGLRTPPTSLHSEIKRKKSDPKALNKEANQGFLKHVIKHLFAEVQVLRTDLGSQRLAAREDQLQIQQLHEKFETAAHNWAREEQRLIRAIEKAKRDSKWNERQWANDTEAYMAELKSATEIMEATEDVVEVLEEIRLM